MQYIHTHIYARMKNNRRRVFLIDAKIKIEGKNPTLKHFNSTNERYIGDKSIRFYITAILRDRCFSRF